MLAEASTPLAVIGIIKFDSFSSVQAITSVMLGIDEKTCVNTCTKKHAPSANASAQLTVNHKLSIQCSRRIEHTMRCLALPYKGVRYELTITAKPLTLPRWQKCPPQSAVSKRLPFEKQHSSEINDVFAGLPRHATPQRKLVFT